MNRQYEYAGRRMTPTIEVQNLDLKMGKKYFFNKFYKYGLIVVNILRKQKLALLIFTSLSGAQQVLEDWNNKAPLFLQMKLLTDEDSDQTLAHEVGGKEHETTPADLKKFFNELTLYVEGGLLEGEAGALDCLRATHRILKAFTGKQSTLVQDADQIRQTKEEGSCMGCLKPLGLGVCCFCETSFCSLSCQRSPGGLMHMVHCARLLMNNGTVEPNRQERLNFVKKKIQRTISSTNSSTAPSTVNEKSLTKSVSEVKHQVLKKGEPLLVTECSQLAQGVLFCCPSNSELLAQIDILSNLISQECTKSHEPYNPKENEICLVRFDDGLWYRAGVLCWEGDTAVVGFLDYGNRAKVLPKDIRPCPNKFLELPILTSQCAIQGFPQNFTKDQIAKIHNEIVEGCHLEPTEIHSLAGGRYLLTISNLLENSP